MPLIRSRLHSFFYLISAAKYGGGGGGREGGKNDEKEVSRVAVADYYGDSHINWIVARSKCM